MLRRKKRMAYDPPGSKARKRKPGVARRSDQIFLTRRVFMVKSAVVAGFSVLAARLGYMQIVKGSVYTEEAESNVVDWVELKPTRGLVFDRAGRPLAENRRTWAVRIIPTELPKRDTAEFRRVRDTLITALRLPDSLIVDRDAVPKEARETVFTRVGRLLGDQTADDTRETIDYIGRQADINYVVLMKKNLSSDEAARINAVKQELPGVEVVNYFDYLVRNYRYLQTEITVKGDVSKEVALKLEANRLYLPGVVLDDSVLVRSYPGGPVMSHILGYVGLIGQEDLDDTENVIRVDEDGNKTYRYYKPDDIIGKNGLERQMESILRGQKGGYWIEKDAYGVEQRQLIDGSSPAVPGRNIQLTIDLELQAAISDALGSGVAFSNADRLEKHPEKTADAKGGAVVMLDPRNGEVLAMASFPQYDNQLFIDGLSPRKMDEYLDPSSNQPMQDRAYASGFAPGSTIKLFMALAGLKEGVIDESTTFTCTGAIQVPWTWNEAEGNYYLCWIHSAANDHHGDVAVVDAIERSCDIFFYNVGTPKQTPEGATQPLHYRDYFWKQGQLGDLHYFKGLGIDKIHDNLKNNFWFGEPTRVELPFETLGLVPSREYKQKTFNDGWSSGDTINTSIGQGYFLVSPLQMAVNTALLANSNAIYRPTIVRALVDDTVNIQQSFPTEVLRKPQFAPEHLALVREGMRRVTQGDQGTANYVYDENYQPVTKWPLTNPPDDPDQITIGGKTGTAEFGRQNEDGTYDEAHAWFTCFAPYENPEVVVTVFVEQGGEGATYAVPIADKALRAYFELTGRRKRGAVLDPDGKPLNPRASTPAATGTPAPVTTPTPPASPVPSDGSGL